jgi:hypothetical protein
VIVPTTAIRSASDFLNAFEPRHALRIDTSNVTADEALETAAALADRLTDLNAIWEDCPRSQQLEYARGFVDLCREIEALGFVCHMGHHKQQLRQKDQRPLVITVGVVTLLPKDQAEGVRYGLIQLEGGWEKLEADRFSLPKEKA